MFQAFLAPLKTLLRLKLLIKGFLTSLFSRDIVNKTISGAIFFGALNIY